MSEEVASADALLKENAELHAAIKIATDENIQHVALERRLSASLRQTTADATAFLGTIHAATTLLRNRPIKTSFDDDIVRLLQHTIDERKGVGAQLLAELEAARAVQQAARAYRTAVTTLNGISAAESALWAALEVHEAAEKARTE
jgi:hypothetical protein